MSAQHIRTPRCTPRRYVAAIGCLIAGINLFGLSYPGIAAETSDPDWVRERVEQAGGSVVMVTVEGPDGRQMGLGTGFVVSPDGLIATNLHVIGEARPIKVRFRDGRALPVQEVHASDRLLDLAILRIADNRLSPLPLAPDAPQLEQGQPILVLGNPMGLDHSVVSGIVSGLREIEGRRMIQLAIPIEPGNSGGPLLDRNGQVRGIVTMKSAVTANLGFAVDVAALKSLLARPNPVSMARWETIGLLDARDWKAEYGARWHQQAGQIHVSDLGDGFGGRALCLWQRPLPQPSCEVGVFVRLEDEAGAAGLVFGAADKDKHFGFYPSAGRLRLTHFNGPTVYDWQILDEINCPHYRAGDWNYLKVQLEGRELKCFVNDQLTVQRTLDVVPDGQVGLAKFRDTRARFKQFRVEPQLPASQLSEERLAPLRQRIESLYLSDWSSPDQLLPLIGDAAASRIALQSQADTLERQQHYLRRAAADLHVQDVVTQLSQRFSAADAPLDLARAALLVSRLDNTELDVDAYLGQFERMADEIRSAIPEGATEEARFAQLNQYLFAQNGYHGSRTNYYHAANSYLDRVLDDREGLPITLSILYMELAGRLGLRTEGVGLPGHFVVRQNVEGAEPRLVDVFDGGRQLTLDDARKLILQMTGQPLDEVVLAAMPQRDIVLRMLRNLQGLAEQQRDREAVLRYLEAMIALDPTQSAYRGMRALIRYETGRKQASLDDLDWFLQHAPPGADAEAILRMRDRLVEERAQAIESK